MKWTNLYTKEYYKIYYIKNKEKYKVYYLKNKEKMIKSANKSYEKNKNKLGFKERRYKILKNWIKNNRDRFNELMRKNYVRNKEKQQARGLAYKIKIPKNQICQICNKNLAVERHHDDYSKPLEITFVCKKCNKMQYN